MRNPMTMLDAGDRRAAAGGAAAGLGLMTLLALRADWFLASGILEFHRTGRNVAAYVLGLDLLPWALLFTAMIASAMVIALGYAGASAGERRGTKAARPERRGAGYTGRARLAGS